MTAKKWLKAVWCRHFHPLVGVPRGLEINTIEEVVRVTKFAQLIRSYIPLQCALDGRIHEAYCIYAWEEL